MIIKPTVRLRLRAAAALLVLALSWLSVPLALAESEPDVCTMECCIEVGHCCCNPHHAFVEGQLLDDKTSTAQAQLNGQCPTSCTAPFSFSRIAKQAATRTQPHELELASVSQRVWPTLQPIFNSLHDQPSSPRAPPTR